MADDGRDGWLVENEIQVDVNQLAEFATHLDQELTKNFQPNFENGVKPLLNQALAFGGSGFPEGKLLRSRYDASRQAIQAMISEALLGVKVLSCAALAVQAEYLNGDAMVQADVESVYNAFTGVDGQPTLRGMMEQQANSPAAADAANDPTLQPPEGAIDNNSETAPASPGDSGGSDPSQDKVIQQGTPNEFVIKGDDDGISDEEQYPLNPEWHRG